MRDNKKGGIYRLTVWYVPVLLFADESTTKVGQVVDGVMDDVLCWSCATEIRSRCPVMIVPNNAGAVMGGYRDIER